jgi:hypothetical protein
VTDFPLLEWDGETKRFYAKHHPFTAPKPEDIPLLGPDPGKVRANAYDLVINGVEIGGGSIRIHNKDLQHKMFRILGFTEEDAAAQFGFLMNAFEYGAPPHGGIAFGFDRWSTIFGGGDSIRDFIAFPKNNSGRDVMIDSPSEIKEEQLKELNIKIAKSEERRAKSEEKETDTGNRRRCNGLWIIFPISGLRYPKSASPRLGGHRVAALVKVEQVEVGLDGFALKTVLADSIFQDGGSVVAPADFHLETAPDFAFLVGVGGAPRLAPGEDLLVGSTRQRASLDVGVLHAKEAAASCVEPVGPTIAEIDLILGGKPARRVQADLVEHPAEIDEAADSGVRTAETGDVGHF